MNHVPSLEEVMSKKTTPVETPLPEDTATFDGQTLKYTSWYDYPNRHSQDYEFNVCSPLLAQYWVAAGGKCWGVTTPQYGQTCIAVVEHAFETQKLVPINRSWNDRVYVSLHQ